jgi:hypothetical protein
VHGSANAADTAYVSPCIARVAAAEDFLQHAHHGSGAVRFVYFSILDFCLNPKVSFDAGDGIYDNAVAHIGSG